MIDPLAIADDIERRAAAYGTDFPVMLTQRGAPLLAAALRLSARASAEDPVANDGYAFVCRWCGPGDDRATYRADHRHLKNCVWAAYLEAKEAS